MPEIDRPNTDAQRTAALQAAKAKADVTAPANLAFTADTLAALTTFLPTFVTEVQERSTALSAQAAATAAANPARTYLDMYIRHFFNVFNMGVTRGRYPATDRAHYQLPVDYVRLPKLGTDAEKLQWANNIVTGDAARILAGGAPMENPTAAEVAAKLTDLNNALAAQSPAKDAYDKEQEDVAALRPQADDIIADVWDEVLFTYRKDDAPSMRRKAREYGVVYRLSNGEAPDPTEHSLQGTVSNKATSLPLLDVEVTIATTPETTLTDANGHYLLGIVTDGTYTIQFRKAGFKDLDIADVAIAAGKIEVVDVQMMELA